ncbi:MAG: hypothetical protein ABR506_04120, partial [Candidatus Krumholzibacteriia bacterium]
HARVMALIRAGETETALAAARRLSASPDADPVLLYNQACLEARLGQADAALTTLARAVARGFDRLEHLDTDPDLDSLRGEPRFAALVTELRAGLVLAAAERGVRLVPEGSGELFLADFQHGAGFPEPASTPASLLLSWRAEGLELKLRGAPAWPADPARRPRLRVTVGLPDPEAPYLTRGAFHFAFGTGVKGQGWGAVWVPTLERWQPVAELTPRFDDQGHPAAVLVPWSLIQPWHPLTDPLLGINAALDRSTELAGPGPAVWSALADPGVFDPRTPTHRVVRLAFDATAARGPAFLGRLDGSIVRGGVLGFELVVVSPQAGPGTLAVDFLDNQARSVLPLGPQTGRLELAAGLQRLPRQASFADLPTGAYQLRAEVGFPTGEGAVWSTTVLNLAPGWADSLAARIRQVPPLEQPTARHLLALTEAAVAAHLPRRHPGPVATTLGDLDAMLERAARTGSVLPPRGKGLLVYPGPDGADRLLTLYRPAPGAERGPETPVLVLDHAPGGEVRLADRLDRFYTHGDLDGAGPRRPLYLVPHLPAGADPAAEARAALDFALARWQRDAVPVAGVNAGAGPALVLATGGDGVAALMVLAGSGTVPWPLADEAFLAKRLAALPPGLPVDWTDFARETALAGQGAALRRLLDSAPVVLTARNAGGALGLSQAADRLVLWAEDLPVPGSE